MHNNITRNPLWDRSVCRCASQLTSNANANVDENSELPHRPFEHSPSATRKASGTATPTAPTINSMDVTASQCLVGFHPVGETKLCVYVVYKYTV